MHFRILNRVGKNSRHIAVETDQLVAIQKLRGIMQLAKKDQIITMFETEISLIETVLILESGKKLCEVSYQAGVVKTALAQDLDSWSITFFDQGFKKLVRATGGIAFEIDEGDMPWH